MNEPLTPELQDLHAYVDGQLAPDARQRVEAHLAADPRAQRQADDYAEIRDGLRALYGPVLKEPVPVRLARPPQTQRWSRPLFAMAASVALLVAGGFIGAQLDRSDLAPLAGGHSLAREAAMAYAVYAPEVRHPVEVPGDQEQHLVAWLTKRLGAQVRAPRLDGLGFQLLGGRLLASADGPGALLMYEDAQGRRVVVYACLNEDKDRSTAFRFAQEDGVSVFHWLEGPLSYGVAGELDRAALQSIAEAVYRQITT
jgi:anti-sigma factor RsiW